MVVTASLTILPENVNAGFIIVGYERSIQRSIIVEVAASTDRSDTVRYRTAITQRFLRNNIDCPRYCRSSE